mgnify:CR=1 FL=1|tara:strand:+ start:4334 stop:5200 length:867 start_codon:yes stop_codon:yes gene_type:complete
MKLSTEIFNGLLEPLFKNKRVAVIVTFFLVFYGGAAGPKLPSFIISLFENAVFRVFILSLIVYKGNSNPMLSIMIAVIFTLTMDMINKQKLFEKFTSIENFSGDISANDLDFSLEGNFEKFADHNDVDNLDFGPNEAGDLPIDSKPEENQIDEQGLINTLGSSLGLSVVDNEDGPSQANSVLKASKDKFRSEYKSYVLTEEELSAILDQPNNGYVAADNLDLGAIVQVLEGLQTQQNVDSMMMGENLVDDEIFDSVDDEIYDESYAPIDDEIDDEVDFNEESISDLGF